MQTNQIEKDYKKYKDCGDYPPTKKRHIFVLKNISMAFIGLNNLNNDWFYLMKRVLIEDLHNFTYYSQNKWKIDIPENFTYISLSHFWNEYPEDN